MQRSDNSGTCSFVYYDDNNNVIPEAAEGSVLMALGLATNTNTSTYGADVPNRDGEEEEDEEGVTMASGGDGEEGSALMLAPYSEDADVFEAKRAAAADWLSAYMGRSASSKHQQEEEATDDMAVFGNEGDEDEEEEEVQEDAEGEKGAEKIKTEVSANHSIAPSGAPCPPEKKAKEVCYDYKDDEEEGEEEEEGMVSFTREATAEDEPWILECILRRRVYKHKIGSAPSSGGAPSSSSSSSPARVEKEVQYLCKWKYYEEPTWEGRTLLEDEGFKGACDAFDGIKAEQSGGVQKNRGRRGFNNIAIVLEPSLEGLLGGNTNITQHIRANMERSYIKPLYYMSVAVRGRMEAFLRTWERLKDTHRPQLLFHGTQSKNIMSIVQGGLKVPGLSGVAVANGSAYGVGIYTAREAKVSVGYSNNRNGGDWSVGQTGEMFACIGLVSNTDSKVKLACNDAYVIFFDSSYVFPLGLVGWVNITKRVNNPDPAVADLGVSRPPETCAPIPRRRFVDCFDAEATIKHTGEIKPSVKFGANMSQAEKNAAVAGHDIPRAVKGVPMTKRMIKEMPRYVKDLYRAGALVQPKKD